MKKASDLDDWGGHFTFIYKIVHPFIILITLLFIFFLMCSFVIHAFATGNSYAGIRSFAGVLLPIVIIVFIFKFQKELLEEIIGRISAFTGFFLFLIVGFLSMIMIRLLGYGSAIPIMELVLSGSFSVLVFSYANLRHSKILSFYYGIICGFLIYIVFLGFPVLT